MRVAALAAFLAVSLVALTTAGPGSGTAIISPSSNVAAGSSGKWSIVYTAAETHDNGVVRLTIPAAWTAPQDGSSTSAGYVTVATNEPTGVPGLTIAGQVITVAVDTLTAGNTLTIVYGDDTAGASARADAATTVGSYSFLVASDPAGGSPSPIVTSPSLNVIASTPASLLVLPSDTTNVDAGTFVQLNIRVLDAFGNRAPVPSNRTVSLFATHGAFYDPANHSTPISSAVIASGTNVKRVDYRPTLVAGSPHTLNVFTPSGSPSLGGTTTVGVRAAAMSPSQSSIGSNSPVVADGVAQALPTVTSRDAFGNPRQGDTVTLSVTGSAVRVNPGSPTNSAGQTSGVVTDTVAELVMVSASINGTPLTSGSASVQFVAGAVSGLTSIVDALPTSVTANGTSTSTITVTARDAQGNPVAGKAVTLFVAPTPNTTLTQPGGVTNALGQVTGTVAATTTLPRTVTATIEGTPVTDNAVVTFTPGPAASFLVVVDGNAVAGTVDPVTITARDANLNIVTNYTGTVNLTSTSTGSNTVEWAQGFGNGVITNTPGSNDGSYTFAAADLGQASIRIIDEKVETITVTANAGGPSGTSGNLVVANNIADKIELVSGNGQSATVNTPVASLPTVRVVDAFNNPVPGATVTFTAVQGGGSVDAISGGASNDSTAITGSDGRIDCDIWRLGTIAGQNRLRARIASGTTTFVYFTATGTAGNGVNLVLTPGSKPVTQGTSQVVTATLTDTFGNARAGERVDIVIKSGLNGTLAEDLGDPGNTTALNPQARWGNTDGAGRITVLWQAPLSAGLADVLDASTSTVVQGNVADVTYTTVASGATNLRITFVGPSTKPANQTFQFLVEAVDGNGNVDTGNTATVTLTPEVGGNLLFSLTDFGSTTTSFALVSGARTVYGRGTVTGDWDIQASGGGLGADTKVVNITDTGVIDHYAVSTVSNVAAGAVFDVTVEARDVYNNRVLGANNAVTLEAYDDINPVLAQATLLDNSATLASGIVTVAETYTKAEAIRVRASAASKEGFSGIVTVGAAAAHRIAKISGDAGGIIAGATQVLTAQVLDQYDNPVNGALVTFAVLLGGGSPSPASATTSGAGQASTTLTTGATIGSNTVKATILDENPAGLERVDYLVTTIPGAVASFTVTPASFALVAGTGVALNVQGFDANANLVTNDNTTPIQLTNTGVAQFGAATGTLTAGQFNTTVVDTVAQSFTITSTRQGGGATGTSALLTVSNSGAYRITKVSGDASGVTAGTNRTLDVLVRDNHSNPVPNAIVTFATTGVINDGTFTDAVGDPNDGITTTDGTGHATITFTTSLTAGANNLNAQILDGVPAGRERVSFLINTVAGGIAYYTVAMSGSTVTAGQSLNATITAFDGNDNPVDDDVTQVDLSGDPGVGLVFGTDPITLTNGVAVTTVTANAVQTYRVRASTLGSPGVTGLSPQVTVNPANPAGVITGTPVPATITANGVSVSTGTSSVITDAFGNQVPVGTLIDVSTNNGVIVPAGAKLVAANGRITFDLRSSTTPGTATVTMTSQVGTATGTTNVTFAPPPAFVANNPATPAIVAPSDNVAFSVQVQNTSTTDANLTTATTFTFTDGSHTFTANLAAPATITGPGTQTLNFAAAVVNAAFTPGNYTPAVQLAGSDEFGAPISTSVSTPAQSLLITSVQITSITAPAIVSRGQTPTVTVFVKNNGAQITNINDIDLVFAPGTGVFTPGSITPQDVAPGNTGQFNIPVLVDPSCPVNTYSIDAVASGLVGGKTVTDNSLAPFTLPTWQIVAAANLSYVAGSMTPMSVSRGASYAFRATIRNNGSGVVSLNETQSYLRFTDGTRNYQAAPTQPYAIAGNSQQVIDFVATSVNAAFTLGSYGVSFHLQGLESGAPFTQDITSGGDQVTVQSPASIGTGSVTPDAVSKGSSVPFSVQVTNSGGATVVLTPGSTFFRFASGSFSAVLNASGPTTLPPGTTTLAFTSTVVSTGITAATYPGQLVLVGTENGNAFSPAPFVTETVIVQEAPSIQITAALPSQPSFTTDQTRGMKVRLVVRNNSAGPVSFAASSLKIIHGGNDRTGQFAISTPTGFSGGATLNGGGAVDTVTFNLADNIANAMSSGMMTIQGHLDAVDVNTSQPVAGDNPLAGALQVQTPATITTLVVLPSLTQVTQNMGRDFIVRAVVQNTGQSDVTVTLAEPSTDVGFSPAGGWVATPRNQFGKGGNILSGGEVDTVLFDVTTSGSNTGTAQVGTSYTGVEGNSGRSVTGVSSNAAQIAVQSPGTLTVTNVVASRSTLTSGANVPWTYTVTLQNTGQSDVNVALPGAVTLAFPGAAPAPGYTVPPAFAGGGTVLSGGETDQLVISVNGTGTYGTMGSKAVNVSANGVELNSGVARNGNGGTNVTVQRAPALNVVSVNPTTVSKGSIVGFAVTIVNTQADAATATLDQFTTRLRFGSNLFNVNLLPASPVDVDGGQSITLLFTPATVVAGIPNGAQADAVLEFRWSENGRTGSENEPVTGAGKTINVQNAPALNILSVRPSRQNVTVGQTTPSWTITMVLRNSNGADVDLDLASATTRLQLNLLGSGSLVTNEYTITQPTQLVGGGVRLSSGETDSLVFNVTQAGNTPGNVIVSGFVGGTDVISSLPVSDNTGDGGSGSFVLQTAGRLNIVSVRPARTTATVGQTGAGAAYTIKVGVRNVGQADVDLDLTAPTNTVLDFAQPAGWVSSVQSSLVGGGVRLSGGEVDTLVFDVTTTGSTLGYQLVYADVSGVELNRGVTVTEDTSNEEHGNITLQAQAALDILSATPSRASLTDAASTPWDLTVVVRNTGESAARLVLPAGLTVSVQTATATFDPVNALEEGGVVLNGGDTGTLVVHAPSSPDFSFFGTRTIGVSLNAVEINSNRAFNRNEPTIGSVVANTVPNLTAGLQVTPVVVTRGTQAFLQVNVTNPGANAAIVDLDRADTRVRFGFGQYSAYLQPGSPTQILAGQTITLSFEDKLVPLGLTAGPYDLSVDLAYTANGFDDFETEIITNGISVQNPPAFRITQISASQPSATAGQTTPWTATMSILNEGVTPIDLDFASNKTYLQFVVPGGGFDNNYTVEQPDSLVGGGTTLGPGLPGQLEFKVTQTGNVTGVIVISGRVEGTDGAAVVSDDTFDGGRGSINVVGASALTIVATHTSQPRVTAGQTQDWDVRVVVANTGGGAINVDLATASIAFNGGTGWVVQTPPTFFGAGNPLPGGAVDSLLFRVTTTSGNAGTRRIDATLPWQDVNTQAPGSSNTGTSGFGSIVVQSRASVQILATTSQSPNPAAVNTGQPFDVRLQVRNTGQADARDVQLALARSGSSTVQPIAPISEIPGGQTVTLDAGVIAAGAANPSETFTSSVTAATDENAGDAATIQSPVDGTAVLAIQNPAVFDIQSVRASQSTLTRGQTVPWNVIARVRNTGQAGAVLTPPAANDLSFAIGGSNQVDYVVQPPTAFGSGAAGWTLAGGATDSLIYSVNVTGANIGTVDIGVAAAGTDRNDPTLNVSDAGGTSVQVQAPAGISITSTLGVNTVNHASADRDTVNTSFAYEIHVVVDNTGGEEVDSVLVTLASSLPPAQRSTFANPQVRKQLGVGGSATFIFKITAPINPVALETFTSTIAAGAKSHNTGLPITPQPPADNRHDVVTQRPANLVMDLTSASPNVSTGQVFTMSATVKRTGTGQAGVSGTARMTLALPGGFALQNPGAEPLVRDFVVGTPVTWNVVAPGAPQASQNLTTTISTTPNDNNTGVAALVTTASDNFGVTVVAGGAFTNPTLAISAPAGAVDGTVSAGQTLSLGASVTATTTTGTIVATLSVPAGFSIVGSPTRNVGTGTGSPQAVSPAFNIIAPATAGTGNVFVTYTGVDQNTQQAVPTSADTVLVSTVARAALSASASVTAPPEATDNTVTIGTTFTVTANVTNAALAAGIGSPGTLTIALPSGYALAGGETASKPFSIATPVAWQVNAPPQPSGPQQINVSISGIPPDENSGQPALVVSGTASIAMVTEGSAVSVRDVSQNLGIDVGPVPAGAAGVALLGFEIAYNVSDASVNDARIDTIAVTIVGSDGTPLGPGAVAATLARLSVDVGGATPYEVTDPSTNPVVVSLLAGGADRLIAPDAVRNAIVSISLDANPSVKEFSVGLRNGGLAVRDAGSGQRLGVTDSQGRPLDGVITSEPLIILSSNFEEYAHNYPNPFRAGSQDTRIAYFMQNAGNVSVAIYALDGDLVYEENIPSSDARAQAGPQETTWDGRNGKGEVVRNGVYVCVLNAGGKSAKFRIAVAK